ncbi:hypothetical protein W02_30410 [Nitrospira sp. KM1]|uniref:DUF72 domain-containing protein n=1 Tax=Nitrospira sp. KM1 TaxID=1936990 RepID=UPI0013A7AC1F|nr:DUF72 domain-containing protein [Nitrospira sp. KM1]BCA55901.1 hypothetical protein W02_30410 [Nitrospira sp. KM1]
MNARFHIGLSGYSYKPWQGPDRFYPPDLKHADFLKYYATRYDTVELDGLWYRLPGDKAVSNWMAATPDHFVFAPKVHRQITHRYRLKPDCYSFLDVMVTQLAPMAVAHRLGPWLIQLPPNLTRDDDRLERFLHQLPRSHRWAVEFRHDSWYEPGVETLLKQSNVSWVAADTDDRPAELRQTADFWYIRLRKTEYDHTALGHWAERIKEANRQGMDCFVYCKHEDQGSPWVWADTLLRLITPTE